MNLLIALEPSQAGPVEAHMRRAVGSFTIATATTSAELIGLLEGEPYEIVVVASALLAALPDASRAILGDSSVIVVTDRVTSVPYDPDANERIHDDFVVATRIDLHFCEELERRVRMAQRHLARATEERQTREAIARALEAVVYRLDRNGRFTYVNEAAAAYGYEPSALIGRHFSEILDAETVVRVSREHVLPRLQGTETGAARAPGLFDERRRGDRRTRDLEVVIKGGRLHDAHFIGLVTASGDVVTRVNGVHEVVGTIGVIRDASRGERASTMLQKLLAMAETAPYGLLVLDSDLTVEYANPGFYRTFSLSPDDVVSRAIDSVPLPELDEHLADDIRRSCDTATIHDQDLEFGVLDGKPVRYRLTARPVFDGDQRCMGSVVSVVPGSMAAGVSIVATEAPPPVVCILTERVVASFLDELGVDPGINAHCDSTHEVSTSFAALLRDLLHDLMEFAVSVIGGGPVDVSVREEGESLQVTVDAGQREDGSTTIPYDAPRVRALVDRSERLRADIERAGGTWTVTRRDARVTFTVVVPPGASRSPEPSPDEVFDIAAFMRAYGDSPEVLDEILGLYETEVPRRVEAVRTGIEQQNFELIASAAHSLANTSGTLQVRPAVQYSRELERAARTSDPSGCVAAARRLLPIVEAILRQVTETMTRRRSGG